MIPEKLKEIVQIETHMGKEITVVRDGGMYFATYSPHTVLTNGQTLPFTVQDESLMDVVKKAKALIEGNFVQAANEPDRKTFC